MAKEKNLTKCELRKKGFCTEGHAGEMVQAVGMVQGKRCTGKVCADFEGRFICAAYPIEEVK